MQPELTSSIACKTPNMKQLTVSLLQTGEPLQTDPDNPPADTRDESCQRADQRWASRHRLEFGLLSPGKASPVY